MLYIFNVVVSVNVQHRAAATLISLPVVPFLLLHFVNCYRYTSHAELTADRLLRTSDIEEYFKFFIHLKLPKFDIIDRGLVNCQRGKFYCILNETYFTLDINLLQKSARVMLTRQNVILNSPSDFHFHLLFLSKASTLANLSRLSFHPSSSPSPPTFPIFPITSPTATSPLVYSCTPSPLLPLISLFSPPLSCLHFFPPTTGY